MMSRAFFASAIRRRSLIFQLALPLALLPAADDALAQKHGGTLRSYIWDSPPSASIIEEATASTTFPFMPVFNNLVVFDPERTSYEQLLKVFWESHDPTQGMRQGNDVGTQYRSAIYTHSPAQLDAARSSAEAFQKELERAGYAAITTEIREAPPFYYAEDYHQQYLAKNPEGYCGMGGTGVACPIGVQR